MKREAGEIDKGAGKLIRGQGKLIRGQGKLRMGEFGSRESRSLLPIGVTLMCSSEAWDRDSVCGQG